MTLEEDIPSLSELKQIMEGHSNDLYEAWRRELGTRLRSLEFEGFINNDDVNLSNTVYRLPNDQLRKAICRLESDLEKLGYDYDFRFEDVGFNWVLFYHVLLPERDEDETDKDRKDSGLLEHACRIPLPPSPLCETLDSDDSADAYVVTDDNGFAY
jgi:hypothetical protein